MCSSHLLKILDLFYVFACFDFVCVCVPRVCFVVLEVRRGYGCHGIEDMVGCELLCGCCELDSGSLHEQQVLLINELSLQSISCHPNI